eukprot:TRINITY_DN4299_c0_g1_i3.p2 TRINITY_DN4299_c0_g1~~TRINITY_DN4299_c0_g1_i3.p2  ORF type:complete len:118 (+),score=13.69 TRINITY_DN4299_c0_g1_i3:66-419(+)
MIRRPPRSTLSSSSAASDVYKRQVSTQSTGAWSRIACKVAQTGSDALHPSSQGAERSVPPTDPDFQKSSADSRSRMCSFHCQSSTSTAACTSSSSTLACSIGFDRADRSPRWASTFK